MKEKTFYKAKFTEKWLIQNPIHRGREVIALKPSGASGLVTARIVGQKSTHRFHPSFVEVSDDPHVEPPHPENDISETPAPEPHEETCERHHQNVATKMCYGFDYLQHELSRIAAAFERIASAMEDGD